MLIEKEEQVWVENFLEKYNVKTELKKPVVALGYDNWIIGGIERVLITIMEKLKGKYAFYLIIPKIDRSKEYYELPENVKLIEIVEDSMMLSRKMALIAKKIKTNVFIGNGNLNTDFLNVYRYLKEFNIKTPLYNFFIKKYRTGLSDV